mmetsp:Transcript_32515/g.68229  ORF Transcript_32515/g.68229 Transcript_32515/m.68229 type:complete len:252 (-) Transcript_32515:148-903(-)
MNYFLVTAATAALFLPTSSHAFLSTKPTTTVVPTTIRSKNTCVFQQQQLFDQNGNPIYDQYGNPMYYDPQQMQQQQYDAQMQQQQDAQQQQYYDQQQQQNQQQQQQQPYANQQQQEEEPTLLISDNMQEEMARATSGIELGGVDYLALARQRAAARVESTNDSTADEWFQMAEEKKRELGNVDLKVDWENWDPADAELDEREAIESANKGMGGGSGGGEVALESYEGGAMITEGGLVVDNVDGEDGPQLLI